MPANLEPVLTLLLIAVLANLVVMGVVLLPPMLGRRSPLPTARPFDAPDQIAAEYAAVAGEQPTPIEPGTVPAGTYDRVVRIVSWVFIIATTLIVAVTGLWPESQVEIFILLACAAAFVLVIHDLLPPHSLGTAKFIVEGSVAITFATLLVLLTGAENSPFFFTFPLIVGGAALVVSPRVTFGLAAVASLGYIFATAVPQGPVDPVTVATVGINLTALVLLAYVATVIAREQRKARDAAIRLSTVDPLTGLFNRTFFFAAVDREIARSLRSNRGFCLLMMDLDELKAINDRYGHYFGDQVLRGVGEVIRGGVRKIDTAARYGGDEFVVLLPETDPTGAWVLAEKVRIGVTELDVRVAGAEVPASISVGVVSFPDDGSTADALMISADQAMYASKRGGKNRVTGLPEQGSRDQGFTTRAIRAAHRLPQVDQRPTSVPIYQTVTFASEDAAELGDVLTGRRPGYAYGRIDNPTTAAFGRAVAELEDAEDGLALATGMAAIHATLISLLSAGDRVVATSASYGTTRAQLDGILRRLGVVTEFVDVSDVDAVERALAAAPTRVLYAETIANPTIVVADHARLADLAHGHGATYVVDNTFASPYLCRPLELGADLVIESATKYLAGHSDVLAGVVSGRRELVEAIRSVQVDTGATLPPISAFLALRGLSTLAIRMDRHSATASALAGWLERQAGVSRVYHPSLASHPQREVAERQLRAGGGMLAFELEGGRAAGRAFIDALELSELTASLGSVFTMVVHPPSTTHRQLEDAALAEAGITAGLLRASIGLEDLDDLVSDFERGLEAARAAAPAPEPAPAAR